MFYSHSLLPYLTLIPLIGAGFILLLPPKRNTEMRFVAISSMFLTFFLALFLFLTFDSSSSHFQFSVQIPWVPSLGISYHVGVDGIGIVMVLLHAILSLSGTLVSRSIGQNVKSYFIFYLILVASIFGVFISLDLFFLYLFYEMVL